MPEMREFWFRRSRKTKVALTACAAVIAVGALGLVAGEGDKVATTHSLVQGAPEARVREAVGTHVEADGYAGDVRIDAVAVESGDAVITARTPEGGFDGPSCADLGDGAEAIFRKVYAAAHWHGGARVLYEGGLIERATGRELPRAKTGVFSISRNEAWRVVWSNDETLANVDWAHYRDFCHPALRN